MSANPLLLLLVSLAYVAGAGFLVTWLLGRSTSANPCRGRKLPCVTLGAVLAAAGVAITAYTAPVLAMLVGTMSISYGAFFAIPRGLVRLEDREEPEGSP